MLLSVTPVSLLAKAVTSSPYEDVMTFEGFFFFFPPFTRVLFHAIYKDVMVSLGGNLLLLSHGRYSLAYPRDMHSFLNAKSSSQNAQSPWI